MPPKINLFKPIKKKIIRKKPSKIKPKPKPKFIIDRRNPYSKFLIISDEELLDSLDEHVLTIKTVPGNIELFRVFNILRSVLPWFMVKEFFIFYSENSLKNIVTVFNEFISLPHVETAIKKSKKILMERKAIPSSKHIPIGEVFKKKSKIFKPIKIKQPFFINEIKSYCESQYKIAPWVSQILGEKINIKGIVVKYNDEIKSYLTDKNVGNDWYIVKNSWYRDVCKYGREFRTLRGLKNIVGYRVQDKRTLGRQASDFFVIEETKAIYDASINFQQEEVEIDTFYDTAKPILLNKLQNFNSSYNRNYIEKILNTFSITNFLNEYSKIVVFLEKLIKNDQIFHQRIKHMQYTPEIFISLTKEEMLPEIYKNPKADKNEMDSIIQEKRKEIIDNFIKETKLLFTRKKTKPELFRKLYYPEVNTFCLKINDAEIDDIIYYEEDGVLYCFEFDMIKNETKNPITNKDFSLEFINQIKKIRSRSIKEKEKEKIIEQEIELAPDLFKFLREEIEAITPIYCSECDEEIFIPLYKSVKRSKIVQFCRKECFDKFNFKE